MIMIIFAMFSNIPIVYKLVLFTVFSGLFGLSLASINASYSIVSAAILGTVGVFIGMFLIGYVLTRYGYDLSWMSGILLVLLLGLIIASIVSFACGVPSNQIWYIYLSLVVFSLYVLYDTNLILRKNYFGDFTNAAMAYYLDIINIFVDLLRLFNR
jgi:FtsH-binding integral membrane protein